MRTAKVVVFSKKIDGSMYVVEAVPDTQKKTAYVVSCYIGSRGDLSIANTGAPPAPALTAKTDSTGISDKIIPQDSKTVKDEDTPEAKTDDSELNRALAEALTKKLGRKVSVEEAAQYNADALKAAAEKEKAERADRRRKTGQKPLSSLSDDKSESEKTAPVTSEGEISSDALPDGQRDTGDNKTAKNDTDATERLSKDVDNEYENQYNKTNWVYNIDGVTKSDMAQFYAKIAELTKLKHKTFQRSSEGEFIIPVDNKLFYTDGDFDEPSISWVLVFNSENYTDIANATEIIYRAEKGKCSYDQAGRAIEASVGKEFVNGYNYNSWRDAEEFESEGQGVNRGYPYENRTGKRNERRKAEKSEGEFWETKYNDETGVLEEYIFYSPDHRSRLFMNAEEDIFYSPDHRSRHFMNVNSFSKKKRDESKITGEEYTGLYREAMTWDADKTNRALERTDGEYTYVYSFDDEYNLNVLNKYKSENIHERGVLENEFERNGESSDTHTVVFRRGYGGDSADMLGSYNGAAIRDDNQPSVHKTTKRKSDRGGYAESAADDDRQKENDPGGIAQSPDDLSRRSKDVVSADEKRSVHDADVLEYLVYLVMLLQSG